MKMVDVSFQTQRGHLEESRKSGVKKPIYVPSGVDLDFHQFVPPDNAFEGDVAFIGKGYFNTRVDLIEAVDRKFALKVYGQRWEETAIKPARNEIGVADFRRVCSSTKIILGIDKATELELYFSNRTWFVLGHGGFLLTRYINGLEQLFANHEHLVWFKDIEECCDLIRFYLAHDDLRKKIAGTGQAFAHEVYPNERMAEFMLRTLFEGETLEPLTDPGPGFESGEAAYRSFTNSSLDRC
jgi:spore maturation protein CgeB